MALGAPCLAEQWRVQYFYDKGKTEFAIADIQFLSATRGVAVGQIVEKGRHQRSVEVVTSDGGKQWQMIDLKEDPLSLFFLNEGLGWMVTTHGLWRTTEAGKNWEKVPGLSSGIFRVYFTSEQDGIAVGQKKKVEETHDGGKHWNAVPAAAEPPGAANYSAYNWVAFATPKYGMISGFNVPPKRSAQKFPDWMDPEDAVNRRETPHLSYALVTKDGGKTWKASSASLFGDVAKVRFGPDGKGLGLIEYSNSFRYPSEAFRVDWMSGASETMYRDKRFAISDVWLTSDGTAYLAGTLVMGQIRNVVPGKVQVLKSKDYTSWTEMPVDYRAAANRVTLAAADAEHLWLATDTGMILKLEK